MSAEKSTGVWFVGARGSVATTAVAGCAALTAGLHPPGGMVTETVPFAGSGLPDLSSLVFGGHDTAHCPLPKRAEELAAAGVLPHGLASAVRGELAAADDEIRTGGPQPGDGRTDDELIAAFAADMAGFRERLGLARVVVVNVSSTEPVPEPDAVRLPPSSLYAAAALRAGCPFVNFTLDRAAHRRPDGCRRGKRTSPRGPRRQDGPDAAPLRTRPDVRAARPVRTGVVGHQPAGRRGRSGAGRSGRGCCQECGQGARPHRHPRAYPAG